MIQEEKPSQGKCRNLAVARHFHLVFTLERHSSRQSVPHPFRGVMLKRCKDWCVYLHSCRWKRNSFRSPHVRETAHMSTKKCYHVHFDGTMWAQTKLKFGICKQVLQRFEESLNSHIVTRSWPGSRELQSQSAMLIEERRKKMANG